MHAYNTPKEIHDGQKMFQQCRHYRDDTLPKNQNGAKLVPVGLLLFGRTTPVEPRCAADLPSAKNRNPPLHVGAILEHDMKHDPRQYMPFSILLSFGRYISARHFLLFFGRRRHLHVDKNNTPHYDYSALLYLRCVGGGRVKRFLVGIFVSTDRIAGFKENSQLQSTCRAQLSVVCTLWAADTA